MANSQNSLIGKRKKQVPTFPNPLFLQWITEWKNDAAEKGMKSQYTYNKALQSLKKHPLVVATGMGCKFLEGFGDKICKMLDEKLTEYEAEYGTREAVPGYITIPIGNNNKSKKNTAPSRSGLGDLDFNNLRVPPPPDCMGAQADHCMDVDPENRTAGQPVRQRRNTGGRDREYIPQCRSGPYAILITLHNNSQGPSTRGYMSKRDLMHEAQPLADKSFTVPDPGCRYTAWSSMGTLIKKGLVGKASNPAKYHLTDAGHILALRVLEGERNGQFALPANSVNEELRFIINDGPQALVDPEAGPVFAQHPQRVPCQSTDTDTYVQTHQRVPGRSIASAANDVCSYDNSDAEIQDIGHESDTMEIEENDLSESSSLKFCYIDELGNEVYQKDRAVVTIDEELGVGFLVKCKYEDLLLSSKRYKLDTSRHTIGDSLFAFLHNNDAPDTIIKPQHLVERKQRGSDSDRIRHTSNKMGFVHNDLPSMENVAQHSHVRDTTQAGTSRDTNTLKFKTAQTEQTKGIEKHHDKVKTPSLISSRPQMTGFSQNSVVSTDSQSRSISQIPSISGDSQSQDSLPDLNKIEKVKRILDKPNFVMKPGNFEVILCVDNQEFYGGGADSKKQMIVRELEKHNVPHHVRPLNIGDFCWIARDKTGIFGENPMELVLDYIVERKRMDDLASSIIDGRFKEQKFRLKNCGLHHPVYLVEDYGSSQHFSIGEDALFQAITNTQIIDGFYVKRTGDTKESAAYLTLMTRYLQSLYAHKNLGAVSKEDLQSLSTVDDFSLGDQDIYLMEFTEFNDASVKSKTLTVKEMFGKQLCQLQGMTPEKAAAILEKYSTPARLLRAYMMRCTKEDKESLLAGIKFGPTQKNVGAALSKAVYLLYNTKGKDSS